MTEYQTPSERAAERYGWRASKARTCPLVVAGRRCRVPYEGHCRACQPWMLSALRRSRVWLTSDGEYVVTGEAWDLGREHVLLALALAPYELAVWGIGPGSGLVEPDAALVIVCSADRTGP